MADADPPPTGEVAMTPGDYVLVTGAVATAPTTAASTRPTTTAPGPQTSPSSRRSVSEDRTLPAHPSRQARSASTHRYQVGRDVHWRVDQIMYRSAMNRETCQYLVRYGGPEEYILSYLDSAALSATTQDSTNANVLVVLFDNLMSGSVDSFDR